MDIEIAVPDGVTLNLEGNTLTVTGERGSVTRSLGTPRVSLKLTDKLITVSSISERKKDLATLGTLQSRIENMFHGVQKGYEYHLKIFHAHFPMNVSVEGARVKIDNFLGEKYPRYAQIVPGTSVKVQGDIVIVTGIDKERVGQTAANLEQATRIKKRDPRVFQDGIYLFERDGVKLK